MDKYRIKQGETIQLRDIDPNETSQFKGTKDEARVEVLQLKTELDALQELLYAEHRRKVLIVLQGMDTSGKDGTIRAVFEGVNPQGVRVASFKVPSQEELDHDYLWRIHKETPGKGQIVIFNRSHYEDVLVVRVHKLVPEEVWRPRYDQIKAFERQLAQEGTLILKFFLHIDMDEQKKRLMERLDEPSKQWKFNGGDLQERKLWGEYQKAYEDAINLTSTLEAPWYIIPANKNWYRNWLITRILVNALKNLNMHMPAAAEGLEQFRQQLLTEK